MKHLRLVSQRGESTGMNAKNLVMKHTVSHLIN